MLSSYSIAKSLNWKDHASPKIEQMSLNLKMDDILSQGYQKNPSVSDTAPLQRQDSKVSSVSDQKNVSESNETVFSKAENLKPKEETVVLKESAAKIRYEKENKEQESNTDPRNRIAKNVKSSEEHPQQLPPQKINAAKPQENPTEPRKQQKMQPQVQKRDISTTESTISESSLKREPSDQSFDDHRSSKNRSNTPPQSSKVNLKVEKEEKFQTVSKSKSRENERPAEPFSYGKKPTKPAEEKSKSKPSASGNIFQALDNKPLNENASHGSKSNDNKQKETVNQTSKQPSSKVKPTQNVHHESDSSHEETHSTISNKTQDTATSTSQSLQQMAQPLPDLNLNQVKEASSEQKQETPAPPSKKKKNKKKKKKNNQAENAKAQKEDDDSPLLGPARDDEFTFSDFEKLANIKQVIVEDRDRPAIHKTRSKYHDKTYDEIEEPEPVYAKKKAPRLNQTFLEEKSSKLALEQAAQLGRELLQAARDHKQLQENSEKSQAEEVPENTEETSKKKKRKRNKRKKSKKLTSEPNLAESSELLDSTAPEVNYDGQDLIFYSQNPNCYLRTKDGNIVGLTNGMIINSPIGRITYLGKFYA